MYNSITSGSVTGDCESEERQRSVTPDCQDPAIRRRGTLHTADVSHCHILNLYHFGPNLIHSLSGLTLNVFGERP